MSDAELLIGSRDSEFIRIVPLARSGDDPTDYWDSNWLASEIEASSGTFKASVRANLRTDEFAPFSSDLARLYETLTGEATFTTLERWVEIRVAGDGRGHFVAECDLRDDPSWAARLRLLIHFDQTGLPSILRGLKAIEESFPVLGKPAV